MKRVKTRLSLSHHGLINILVEVSFLSRRGAHGVNLYWAFKFMNQLLNMSRKLTLLSLTIDEHEN